MKKYIQITVVLGLFFSFVIFKSLYKGDDENVQVGVNNVIPSQAPTSTFLNSTSDVAPTQSPSSQSSSQQSSMMNGQMMSQYKDGTFTGTSEDAVYGNIKVQVVISNGKITDVIFLDHPGDNRTSDYINSQAMPMLKAEAISAQSANVNIISGASDTSMAFQQSLASALASAK
jgi:uncharacterized protein with FMN-binding domain